MTEGGVVWLYAVMRQDDCEPPPSMRGVAGESVRFLAEGTLVAVVGSVDARQYGSESLARKLESLDWLAEAARIHDAVVAAAAEHGPVVPVRLATVFAGDDGVRELLRGRRDDFLAALDTVTGRTEWGVKAYVDPDSFADSLAGQAGQHRSGGTHSASRSGSSGAGSAYLMRRRAQLAARQTAEGTATALGEEIHTRLRRLCAASRLHPAQDPQLTGRRDWMILNAAYLVDQEHTAPFHALVEQLAEWKTGLDVELTGPWPPYSFAVPPGARHD